MEADIHRDVTGVWKRDIVVDSEVQAKAWLNELANIGEPADKTTLSAAIVAAELILSEDYTSASWVAVALANAQAVEEMTSPTQSEVDGATLALTNLRFTVKPTPTAFRFIFIFIIILQVLCGNVLNV